MSSPYCDLSYNTHLLSVSGTRSLPEIAVEMLLQILQKQKKNVPWFRMMNISLEEWSEGLGKFYHVTDINIRLSEEGP